MPGIGERPEITFEKILVATDSSPVSEVAVQYAAALARRCGAPLELLNVIDLSFAASSTGTLIGPAIDVIKEDVRAQLESASATITGMKVELKLLEAFSPREWNPGGVGRWCTSRAGDNIEAWFGEAGPGLGRRARSP